MSIASGCYTNIGRKLSGDKYHKPTFNSLFKKIRKLGFKTLNALEKWPPSEEEIKAHKDKDSDPTPNWAVRMKYNTNCTFLDPKYRQLIYYVTTNTIIDGLRLHRSNPNLGLCPFCNIPASSKHMFIECPKSKEVWDIIDQLGNSHWGDYTALNYDFIPIMLKEYDPIKLYQISALWAIWTTWCSFFYDQHPIDNWVNDIICAFKDQFILRVAEAPAMVQWFRVAQDRRASFNSDAKIPEKEFLLIHAQQINTRSKSLPMREGEIDPLITKWVGNSFLLDYDALNGNKPRLKINYQPWLPYLQQEDQPIEPPTLSWSAGLPQSVVGF